MSRSIGAEKSPLLPPATEDGKDVGGVADAACADAASASASDSDTDASAALDAAEYGAVTGVCGGGAGDDDGATPADPVCSFTGTCHLFFAAYTTVAIVALLCMAAAQISLLTKKDVAFLQVSLRFYIVVFCLLFVLVETDAPRAVMRGLPTKNWLMRGWIYSFLGLVGMEEAYSNLVAGDSENIIGSDLISVFVQLSSWGMVIVGCGYFLMGLLCLRGLKDRVEEDYRRFGGAAHQC